MPLPLTVSCSSKIQIGFTFLVLAHPGSPGQRAIKRVCVCVCKICKIIPFLCLKMHFLPNVGLKVAVMVEMQLTGNFKWRVAIIA